MGYKNVTLDKDHLLAFLVRPDTGFKEHYVSSRPLNIYIPYTAYLALVKDLVSKDLDILRISLSNYKIAFNSKNRDTLLVRLYYYELAFAGFNELIKSSKRGKLSTRIYACFNSEKDEIPVEELDVSNAYDFIKKNFKVYNPDEQEVETKILQADLKEKEIPLLGNPKDKSLEYDGYMYYVYFAYYATYRFWKNKFITFKGE